MNNITYWNPRVYLWDGGWIGLGHSQGVVPPHRHHAIQICIALEGKIRLRTPDTDWQEYDGAVVRPDEDHSFDGCGVLGAMLFVDPECHEGRWLLHSLRQTISPVPPARREPAARKIRQILEDPPSAEAIAELIASAVRDLCAGPPPLQRLDDRILRALEIIQSPDASKLSLDSVAKAVYLSPSRFAHLFTEQVGLPFRRYVLWRKLNRAMTLVRRGDTLSAAAHQTGFSDSAHLTRTFYQMFGIPPTSMLPRTSEAFEIPAPFSLLRARE